MSLSSPPPSSLADSGGSAGDQGVPHAVDLSHLADLLAQDASSPATAAEADAEDLHQDDMDALERMVLHPSYPCLGARSVFTRKHARIESVGKLGTVDSAERLLSLLTAFGRDFDPDGGFTSLLAVFHAPSISTEAAFERLLWRQLELLHAADHRPWDPTVSDDHGDPHFAFSVAGRAYFVVGLHPHASRIARRMPHPTLVFNVHEQFEQLRQSEHFQRMRDTIRRRDVALQGDLNPMVADFGANSEARQYSGRAVAEVWEPPGNVDFTTSPHDADHVGPEPTMKGMSR